MDANEGIVVKIDIEPIFSTSIYNLDCMNCKENSLKK